MRILADLPDEDVKWLDRLADETGKSRAALLREAVVAYRLEAGGNWIDQGYGLWARHGHSEDGVAFQRRMRGK